MSKDIIVIAPNGRRQKIHCSPDTRILQVLEDVCLKQGFQPSDYELKHHTHILDLTTTIRFSNLPNKAMLEMVKAERKREESVVTIGLQLEDGERRAAPFPPNTCLYDVITALAPNKLNSLKNPSILYMRQEVTGELALREKTLRQLGLIKGRGIMRLRDKQPEARQANVSAVYRRPVIEKLDTNIADTKTENKMDVAQSETSPVSGPSESKKTTLQLHEPDLFTTFKEIAQRTQKVDEKNILKQDETMSNENDQIEEVKEKSPMEVDSQTNNVSSQSLSQENLERRLKIEEEVTFLGAHKAIAFLQPDNSSDEIDDLPDDFYDLTIEEVRRLYHDLEQHRISLENTPLISSSKREDTEKQASEQKLNTYKNVVVRIQFPDHIILQGIFTPMNTIEDVNNFIREHLQMPDKEFHIFTTPLREALDSKITLLEAKFVPCVHMHFKWLEEDTLKQPYLKEEIYAKKTAADAAKILASKYRAPSRRKLDESVHGSQNINKPSTSNSSKVPRWFKN